MTSLAVDPHRTKLFWSNFGGGDAPNSTIETSDLDGANRVVLVSDCDRVFGLSLDSVSQVIYWSDVRRKTIEMSHYSATGRRVLVRGVKFATSLALFEDRLFWTDALDRQLFSANRFTGTSLRKVRRLSGVWPSSLLIQHDLLQPMSNQSTYASCPQLGCDFFCFAKSDTAVCHCPDFYRKSALDQSKCLPFEDNFLYLATRNQIFKAFLDGGKASDEIIPLKVRHSNLTAMVATFHNGIEELIWVDTDTNTINAAYADGSHQTILVDQVEALDIDLDHELGLVYFIDKRHDSKSNLHLLLGKDFWPLCFWAKFFWS